MPVHGGHHPFNLCCPPRRDLLPRARTQCRWLASILRHTTVQRREQRVPHRAWRPVRSDKELSGDLPALSDPASEDLQGGGVFSVVVGLYDDVHVLIEGD